MIHFLLLIEETDRDGAKSAKVNAKKNEMLAYSSQFHVARASGRCPCSNTRARRPCHKFIA